MRTVYLMHGVGYFTGRRQMKMFRDDLIARGVPADKIKYVRVNEWFFWLKAKSLIKKIEKEKVSPYVVMHSNGGIQFWFQVAPRLSEGAVRCAFICDSWIKGRTRDSVQKVVYYNSPGDVLGSPSRWDKEDRLRTEIVDMSGHTHVGVLMASAPDIYKRMNKEAEG